MSVERPNVFCTRFESWLWFLVLVRESLVFEMKSILTDDNGRYILLNVTVQGSDYIMGNIYSPDKIKEQCTFLTSYSKN